MSDPGDTPQSKGQPGIAEAALFGLCPDCGSRTLFDGPIKFADRCRVCGLDYSRFVEVMNAHGPSLSVRDISQIPLELIERLEAQRAHIEFRFPYFIEKRAPVSGSPEHIEWTVFWALVAWVGC